MIDLNNEFIIELDSKRVLSGFSTSDGATFTVAIEDPHSIAIVEITRSELTDYIEKLMAMRDRITDASGS